MYMSNFSSTCTIDHTLHKYRLQLNNWYKYHNKLFKKLINLIYLINISKYITLEIVTGYNSLINQLDIKSKVILK